MILQGVIITEKKKKMTHIIKPGAGLSSFENLTGSSQKLYIFQSLWYALVLSRCHVGINIGATIRWVGMGKGLVVV